MMYEEKEKGKGRRETRDEKWEKEKWGNVSGMREIGGSLRARLRASRDPRLSGHCMALVRKLSWKVSWSHVPSKTAPSK